MAWALAAIVLAAHLATSAGYGYFRDELYYLACSAHPALGYVDFPPIGKQPYRLTLGPYGFFWLELHAQSQSLEAASHADSSPLVAPFGSARMSMR